MIKHVNTIPPSISIAIFAHALIVKAIDLSDLSRLVVTSQQSHAVWVSSLQQQKQCQCLHLFDYEVIGYMYTIYVCEVEGEC
jgi:hypothetical protein